MLGKKKIEMDAEEENARLPVIFNKLDYEL